MLQCCKLGAAHSAVEIAVQPQATGNQGAVHACPGKVSTLEGPPAHLQEVTKLLSPSVLQMVVTLKPLKHVLQAQGGCGSNTVYR